MQSYLFSFQYICLHAVLLSKFCQLDLVANLFRSFVVPHQKNIGIPCYFNACVVIYLLFLININFVFHAVLYSLQF